MSTLLSRRRLLKLGALAAGGLLASCTPKTEIVEKEIEKIVKETVEVEKVVKEAVEVEKEVTRVVEKKVAAERVEITMTGRLGSEDVIWDELKGEFYEDNPDILVKVQAFPGAFTDYLAKVQALAAAGTLGDVLYTSLTTSLFDVCVHSGLFATLDDLIASEGFNPAEIYYEASLKAMLRNGQQYGLPHLCHPSMWFIFYNPDLFAEAGVEPPDYKTDTLDSLVEKAKALTKDTNGDGEIDQYGLYYGYDGDVMIQGATRLFGGQLLDAPMATKSYHNSQEAKDGIRWMHDLIYTHKVAPSPMDAPQGIDPLFKTGKLAMALNGAWMSHWWGQDQIKDFETQVDLCPEGPTGGWWGTVHTTAWSLVKATKHQSEAWRTLLFLSGPAASYLKGRSGRDIAGCSPQAWTNPELMERRPGLSGGKFMELFHTAMQRAESYYLAGNFRNNELFTAQDQKLDSLWTGSQEPTDAFFDELQDACQAVLDKPKP